ncbi:DUF397 domain-containing protein [Streptomyces sp. PSRA5]|uniref:DUF397 domain-containing protein n=1 Tax=Streptomyces panacea TaxID=3035064 RepID=UPI00339CA139
MNVTPAPESWVKSTYSSPEGGNCVEWSPAFAVAHGVVPVRDSKLADGPVLTVSPDGWHAFVRHVRAT